MITADALKDIARVTSDEAYKNNWEWTDYLVRGFERAGLMGRGNFGVDAYNAQNFGGNALEAALGPTSELFGRLSRAAHDGQMLDVLFKQVPGSGLVKYSRSTGGESSGTGVAGGLNPVDMKGLNEVLKKENLNDEQKKAVVQVLKSAASDTGKTLADKLFTLKDTLETLPTPVKEGLFNVVVERVDETTQNKLRKRILDTLGESVLVEFSEQFGTLNEKGSIAQHANLSEKGKQLFPGASEIISLPEFLLGRKDSGALTSFVDHEITHGVMSRLLSNPKTEHMGQELVRVANSKFVRDQITKILKDHGVSEDGVESLNKYIGDSPEEAVAYAYQYWNQGLLKLGVKPNDTLFLKLQRIVEFAKGLLFGRDGMQAMFELIRDGEFSKTPVTADDITRGKYRSRELGFLNW